MRYASLFNFACAISYGPHNAVIFLYCFSLNMFEGRHRPHHFWPKTNERPLFKLYFTKTIHISVLPFSFQSKTTLKCGRKKKVVHRLQPNATLLFLPHVCVFLNFVSLFMVSISRLGPMIELGTIHIKTFEIFA